MRARIRRQLSLAPQQIDHEHCKEVGAIGAILDAHPELAEQVERDLLRDGVSRDWAWRDECRSGTPSAGGKADEPIQL